MPRELTPDERILVERALRDIDGDSVPVREAAGKILRDFGQAARPLLMRGLESASPEGRMRISEILESMPESVETAEFRSEPTRITIHAESQSFRAILSAIARSSGVTFPEPLNADVQGPLTFNADNLPLFEVLDRLSTLTGLRWQQDYAAGTVRWYQGSYGQPLVKYRGPFRISLTNYTHNSTMTFGGEPSEQCYVYGQVDVEPGVELLGIWTPPTMSAIDDSEGRSLGKSINAQAPMFNASMGRSIFPFTIAFPPPPAETHNLKKLAGKFVIAVPKTLRTVQFDVAQPTTTPGSPMAGDGLTTRLVSCMKTTDRMSVTIELERQPLVIDDKSRQQVQDIVFYWVTRDGEVRHPSPPGRQMQEGREMLILVPPPHLRVGDIDGLRMRVVMQHEKREVPFEFLDVPLP